MSSASALALATNTDTQPSVYIFLLGKKSIDIRQPDKAIFELRARAVFVMNFLKLKHKYFENMWAKVPEKIFTNRKNNMCIEDINFANIEASTLFEAVNMLIYNLNNSWSNSNTFNKFDIML